MIAFKKQTKNKQKTKPRTKYYYQNDENECGVTNCLLNYLKSLELIKQRNNTNQLIYY